MIRSERGSALIITAVLMVAMSLLSVSIMNHFDTTRNITSSWQERRKVFYMAEGVRKIATQLIENYMAVTAKPTGPGVQTYLNANLPPLVPAPYTISAVTATVHPTVNGVPLPNGPYQSMLASVTNVDLTFTVSMPSTALNTTSIAQLTITLALGQISEFQFSNFFDIDYASWWPNTALTAARVHANGILCMGGGAGLDMTYATSGQNLYEAGNGACWRTNTYGGGNKTTIHNLANIPTKFLPNGDSGCVNCLGTGLAWKTFAKSRWSNHAEDSAQNMKALRFPGVTGQLMQFGIGFNPPAAWQTKMSNINDSRFLVDPPQAADAVQPAAEKFASQADIRILDGVWYLKDPANSANWPGVPIWSDHPGSFTDSYGVAVGQDDLRARWAGKPTAWTAGSTPNYYSYYEYDSANQTIFNDSNGVISYGTVAFKVKWMPGFWVDTEAGGLGEMDICNYPASLHGLQIPGGGGAITANCGGPSCTLFYLTHPVHCKANYPDMVTATKVLAGARGGFRDGHLQDWNAALGNMLPINFDLTMFQSALANVTAGELGSYFGAANFMGRAFNGVVYISGLWPGSCTGYGTDLPSPNPNQGHVADASQSGEFSVATQQALPFPLCSTAPTAGTPFETASQGPTTVNRFFIPDCTAYGPGPAAPTCGNAANGAISAFPNAVRLINGATLSKASFPSGLSIVSNLPMYVLGNYNTASSAAANWVPALVAGDQMGLLSSSWTEAGAPWNIATDQNARTAGNTTYYMAMMNGWAEYTDAQTNPGFNEDWTGKTATINGAFAIGFHPVYYQYPRRGAAATTYKDPTRAFNYDANFAQINNQPPGMTFFETYAIMRWRQL
jgi:hypothetical protein